MIDNRLLAVTLLGCTYKLDKSVRLNNTNTHKFLCIHKI